MIVFGPPALFAVAICVWVVFDGSFPNTPEISREARQTGIFPILFNWGIFILFWALLAGFLFILGIIAWFRTYAALAARGKSTIGRAHRACDQASACEASSRREEELLERRSLKKINKR